MGKIETFNLNEMFGIKEEAKGIKEIEQSKIELYLSDLIPFRNHPFKLYKGERLDDMVESIKEFGIITPLIVRPLEDGKYEILSGHNRVNAGKLAGLEKAPVVIKEDLTDEEAMLIVTETNLIQRSFAELSHSEKARILTERHEAEKRWGKNSSKINEIEMLSNIDGYKGNSNLGQIGPQVETRDKIANSYDLSPRNVSRYIRIDMLIDELKIRLDNNEIPFIAAVDLSYLKQEEQEDVELILKEGYKIDLKKADVLKSFSRGRNFTYEKALDVLSGKYFEKPKKKSRPKFTAKFTRNIVEKYFNENQTQKEIEETIEKALELYFLDK